MHYVLLHDPPPFIMYSCIMYCYMTHHPSSCIHALCIVTSRTTLHHVLLHYVLLHRAPPFIIVKVIRNSEVLTIPTSFDNTLFLARGFSVVSFLLNKQSFGLVFTSSTAQCGGGSFKNRKPIGELGCCESGMAERIH